MPMTITVNTIRALVAATLTLSCGAPAAQPARAGEGAPPSATISCDDLAYDAEDPLTDGALELCNHYREELTTGVAAKAKACMQEAGWSACDRSRCTLGALASAPREPAPACAQVEAACEGMGELCAEHASGMTPRGRERFARCLVDHCGKGLGFCLWDPMVTPCEQRAPRP